MVTFHGDDGTALGSIAVSGADLLYYRQFQAAVLALAGELYRDSVADASGDPQRAWLDRLSGVLPAAGAVTVTPESGFDERDGRTFHFSVTCAASRPARVDSRTLLDYQEFQAALAHQCGVLFRDPEIESIADTERRRSAWTLSVQQSVAPPAAADALIAAWPWR